MLDSHGCRLAWGFWEWWRRSGQDVWRQVSTRNGKPSSAPVGPVLGGAPATHPWGLGLSGPHGGKPAGARPLASTHGPCVGPSAMGWWPRPRRVGPTFGAPGKAAVPSARPGLRPRALASGRWPAAPCPAAWLTCVLALALALVFGSRLWGLRCCPGVGSQDPAAGLGLAAASAFPFVLLGPVAGVSLRRRSPARASALAGISGCAALPDSTLWAPASRVGVCAGVRPETFAL